MYCSWMIVDCARPASQYGWRHQRRISLTISSSVHRALQEVSIEHHPGLNSPSMPAAGTGALDIAEDTKYHRHSADRVFLPAKSTFERRARLKIYTDALVTRVEFLTEGDEVRVTGVHFAATNARKAWNTISPKRGERSRCAVVHLDRCRCSC